LGWDCGLIRKVESEGAWEGWVAVDEIGERRLRVVEWAL
jgi:hypothetical protein